jgi:hypothetical protein
VGRNWLTIYFAQIRGIDEELAAARVHADSDASLGGEVVHLHGGTLERDRHSLPCSIREEIVGLHFKAVLRAGNQL